MNDNITHFEKRLEVIEQRNSRVESDKAWETSASRITAICIITYIIAGTFLYFIGIQNFWLSAFVPTIGFFLSTQTLPALKRWWVNNHYKK
jgi:hypothetical protein